MAASIAVVVLGLCLASLAFVFGIELARYSAARDACERASRAADATAVAILLCVVVLIFLGAAAGMPS